MTTAARWILAASILGSGMVFLDSTVVTVALPRIGRELPTIFLGVFEGQTYVYAGYLLTLSALLVLAGAANDHFGRKRMFQLGIASFGIISVLCGLAPNMETLVLFRVLQGAAGALLVPSSLSLITASFQGEQRGRAFGYWSGASAATTILGPVIGGALVDSISWRAAFLVNVPVALAALYATREVEESRDAESAGTFDWIGSLICALAVGGLAFGAIYGQQREWRDPLAFALLAVGAVATIALPFWMARAPHPLIPLELFRSRNFSITNLSTFLIYGALYITFYYFALFLQGVIGYTAAAAGLAGIPGTLILALFSSRVGSLGARIGQRPFMVVGPLIMALGVLTFAFIPADSAAWRLGQGSTLPPLDYVTRMLPGLLLFGIGITLLVSPLVTALMGSVPVSHSGLASAINNAISRVGPQLIGAVLFVAVSASFYTGMERRMADRAAGPSAAALREQTSPLNPPKGASSGDALATASREASTDAFHLAMLVAAGLLVVGAVVNVGIRDVPIPKAAAEAPTPAD